MPVGPKNKTNRAKIRNRESLAQAMELRKAGASFRQIGERLGVTKERAFQIVTAGLRELGEKCAAETEIVRALEVERLDALLLSHWPNRQSPRVTDTILRIMERRARMMGLDAPAKVEATGPGGGPIALTAVQQFQGLTDEELKTMLALAEKAAAADEASILSA